MAKMPLPAAPADDEDISMAPGADDSSTSEDDTGDDSSEGEDPAPAPEPDVVATILRNADGTYQVIAGDEPEGDATEGEGSDEEGAAAPVGQSYDSIGAVLKGVLDTLKTHEANMSGEGSDDENFDAGFAGGSSASPPKMMPPPGGM